MAACQKGLDLPGLNLALKSSFLYTEGMALEGAGDADGAKKMYERSLAYHPATEQDEADVDGAIARLERLPPGSHPVSFPCGRVRCAKGQLCCGDKKCIDSEYAADHDCSTSVFQSACDVMTNEPCSREEECAARDTGVVPTCRQRR